MAKQKMITDAEERKIKRVWASKGDTLGLRLVARQTAGSFANMSLALDPVTVKDAWVKSNTRPPFNKLREFGIATGLADASFAHWFEVAAPELFQSWVESAAQAIDDAMSAEVRAFVISRTRKGNRSSREETTDWEVLRKVLLEDRSPMSVALAAAGAKAKNVDAAFAALLDAHGIPEDSPSLTKADAALTASIRHYLKRRREGALLDAVAEELGLHPESLRWRLRHCSLTRPDQIDLVESVLKMWREGESVDTISQTLGLDRNSVAIKIADYAPRG